MNRGSLPAEMKSIWSRPMSRTFPTVRIQERRFPRRFFTSDGRCALILKTRSATSTSATSLARPSVLFQAWRLNATLIVVRRMALSSERPTRSPSFTQSSTSGSSMLSLKPNIMRSMVRLFHRTVMK